MANNGTYVDVVHEVQSIIFEYCLVAVDDLVQTSPGPT